MRGPSLDLKPQILDRIATVPGAVWTPVDFLDLGPRAAIDKALQRLVKAQELERLDRGIYYLPRLNSLTGRHSTPETRAVVDAVGRRDQARLVVDGMTAANDLGLTTAVPGQVVVQSDARLRPIQLSNQKITFKQAAPSRLFWAGRPAMRIVQALHWLQDIISSHQDGDVTARLHILLSDPARGQLIRDDLRDGLPTLPIWMQSYLRDLLESADPTLALPLGRPVKRSTSPKPPTSKKGGQRSSSTSVAPAGAPKGRGNAGRGTSAKASS